MMGRSVGNIILLTITIYLVYVLVSIAMVLIWGIVSKGNLPDLGDDIPSFFWFITLDRKRIYYSDLGYFYVSIKGDYVRIYKQGPIMSHYLFNVWYSGDIESLRSSIKDKLDSLYREELEESLIKKLKKDKLKDWDGYIDIVSKRDDRLNQILK
jgi:hypothetical protein